MRTALAEKTERKEREAVFSLLDTEKEMTQTLSDDIMKTTERGASTDSIRIKVRRL